MLHPSRQKEKQMFYLRNVEQFWQIVTPAFPWSAPGDLTADCAEMITK
jgi:hypothetical protein